MREYERSKKMLKSNRKLHGMMKQLQTTASIHQARTRYCDKTTRPVDTQSEARIESVFREGLKYDRTLYELDDQPRP